MIAIIDVSGNNLRSIGNAIKRLNLDYVLTHEPDVIATASHIILPGVGNAQTGMKALAEHGLVDVLQQAQQPMLGICLGMQLFFEYSEEGDVACLGRLPGKVERLAKDPAYPVPHMGWNKLLWSGESFLNRGIEKDAYVYFVHSYAHVAQVDSPHAVASCAYGQSFTAIVAKDNICGMQFHPEKSADTGLQLLANFFKRGSPCESSQP